ncbi:hypothetical protein CHS0354_041616 [Potamilus streckersoni]|uniref:Tubulin-specific chaperone C n=1 Tax=Potamilus streckersoni TaxID=2493646 RepID=A0AAE0VVJ8_9BIVA|nr:hypothetical protein CHS0354_041616 [Potamilus streckersoni]
MYKNINTPGILAASKTTMDSGTKLSAPATSTALDVEGKWNIVSERLQKREDERLSEIQKKKEQKSETAALQESTNFFNTEFNKEKVAIEAGLSECDRVDKANLIDRFDLLSLSLQKMQKFLAESTMFLPPYEVRLAQEAISKLQTQIQEKRDDLFPKKRFAFKSKKKVASSEKQIAKTLPENVCREKVEVALTNCKYEDLKDQSLEKFEDEINNRDVALARLENCTVKLYGAPSAVHMNKLNNCRVFTGPVSSSIFITECQDCVFVLPCQQLRIHTTKNSQFYIHVTSRAIIEDCSGVKFGPFNWKYPGLNDHYKISGLSRSKNSWNDIDDFNWLASDTHSPNWSLIPEGEFVKSWDEQIC